MTKKIINDLILPKKSIRQIPISAERKIRGGKDFHRPVNWQRRPLNPKVVIWIIALISLLALFFSLSLIFSSATIIVTPRTEKIVFVDESFIVKAEKPEITGMTFETLKIERTLNEVVEATEEKMVNQKASGKIIIYNNYSTVSQRLINNTRFESTDGRIYRINTSVVVPGQQKVNGQIVPGSIEAVVYADQPGEDYNLKVSDLKGDFKIPGFKGDLRYQNFYARLKEDIQGGYIGPQRLVSADRRLATENLLKEKLKEQLLRELYIIKPEDYLFFADGYSLTYTNLADTAVDEKQVQINLKGNLGAIVFNGLKLSKYLATQKLKDFDGLPTILIPEDDFIVEFKVDNSDWLKNDNLAIKLKGEATIKWLYDGEAIREDLAGRKEVDLKNSLAKYQNSISGLKVLFRPVWTRYFPDDLKRIRIQEGA